MSPPSILKIDGYTDISLLLQSVLAAELPDIKSRTLADPLYSENKLIVYTNAQAAHGTHTHTCREKYASPSAAQVHNTNCQRAINVLAVTVKVQAEKAPHLSNEHRKSPAAAMHGWWALIISTTGTVLSVFCYLSAGGEVYLLFAFIKTHESASDHFLGDWLTLLLNNAVYKGSRCSQRLTQSVKCDTSLQLQSRVNFNRLVQ